MVKRYLLVAALLVLSGTSCATQQDDAAPYPGYEDLTAVSGRKQVGIACISQSGNAILYENKLPKIKSVTVTRRFSVNEKEAESDPQALEYCSYSADSPTEQDIKTFFTKADTISHYTLLKTLYYDKCRAEGTIIFSNGKKADWYVDTSGTGGLWFENASDEGNFYFCPTCSEPFKSSLSDDDEEDSYCYGKTNPIYYSKDKK